MTHDEAFLSLTLRDGTTVILDADVAGAVEKLAFRRDPTSGAVVRKQRVGASVKTQTLAQFVMESPAPRGMLWHHRNGDPNDFRRGNIEAVRRGTHLAEGHHRKAGLASARARGERSGADGTEEC